MAASRSSTLILEASPVEVTPIQERILDAAERCAGRYGLRRFSMSDVAAQAGVSRGSVYLHFGDRAGLVDALLERVAAGFVSASRDSVCRRRTLAAQVGEAAVFIHRHMGDRGLTLALPGEEESLIAVLLTAQAERLVEQWIEFWQPLLQEGAQRGELRPDLDHRRAGEWIVRMLISFAVMPSACVDLDDDSQIRAFVRDHLVPGLGDHLVPESGGSKPSPPSSKGDDQ
ncbi:MAG TPA: TetR/AcrR family transcriptional regulator [Acidimicrobiales bacterium]|nr:TetR/AcrR family transcriptional regulator [Acidimicrobiales bacterium]